MAGQAFAPQEWKQAFDFTLPPLLWDLPADQVLYQLALGLVLHHLRLHRGHLGHAAALSFTVMLTVNLEPVYTIVIALLIWGTGERLTTGSYLGIVLILACLFLNGWWQRRSNNLAATEPDPLSQG
jgi:hypothetical protein